MSQVESIYDRLGLSFDINESLDKQNKAAKAAKEADQRQRYLIHRAFRQNEAGAELIDLWKDRLLMNPVANAGDDLLQIGINEGINRFVRSIILVCDAVEKGE